MPPLKEQNPEQKDQSDAQATSQSPPQGKPGRGTQLLNTAEKIRQASAAGGDNRDGDQPTAGMVETPEQKALREELDAAADAEQPAEIEQPDPSAAEAEQASKVEAAPDDSDALKTLVLYRTEQLLIAKANLNMQSKIIGQLSAIDGTLKDLVGLLAEIIERKG